MDSSRRSARCSRAAAMRLLVAAILLLAQPYALSQAYPTRVVRITAPGEPGIQADLFARLIAPRLTTSLGQPVIVENRSGGGGTIAVGAVERAAPDGHNILMATPLILFNASRLARDLPYDPSVGLTPVTAMLDSVQFLVMRPTLPFTTLKQVIDYA